MAAHEYSELIKTEVLEHYYQRCKASGVEPHRAFVRYL